VNIDEKRIRRIFDELNMGEIQRIDVVCKTTEKGEKFNRVFIHFKRWFSNENSDTARERLLNGKEIKIIYDDPWFWKVSAYREANKAPPRQEAKPAHKKASLQFDSDEDRPARTHISSRDTDDFGRNNYDRRPRDDRDDRRPRNDRGPRNNERPRNDRGPRNNERPRDGRPRDVRPRDVRPRDDKRPRDEVKKVVVPRSPSNSPPRRRVEEEVPVPNLICSSQDIEDGEISE
jgi:hypothetical protein